MTFKELLDSSYLGGVNSAYLEDLYDQYLQDANSVPAEWQNVFSSFPTVAEHQGPDVNHEDLRQKFLVLARAPKLAAGGTAAGDLLQEKVDQLIESFRRFGHIAANLDPLGLRKESDPRLEPGYYGLGAQDMAKMFATRGVLEKPTASLDEIFNKLSAVYTDKIGVEFSHIDNQAEFDWIKNYAEHNLLTLELTAPAKKQILKRLTASEGFEHYLGRKYVGQKRFSVEGGESVIPMLDEIRDRLSYHSTTEMLIGMAHRGRLNVQVNVMGRSPKIIFDEFEGKHDYGLTTGDVKYHMGYSSDVTTPHGHMHLSLGFNPSHLEFINPVVMGSVRARQEQQDLEAAKNYAVAVLIHGDSAFYSQGIVQETLAMMNTRGYGIGGTVHIIINNQVGFTTSNKEDIRSTRYCSDPAKMIAVPILHVNGDDPEAVIKAARMAVEYRQAFNKDVVLDLVCYRRHGHNEGDEPSATQPLMYQVIKKHQTTRELYAQKLVQEKNCTEQEVQQMIDDYRELLDANKVVVEHESTGLVMKYRDRWTPFFGQHWDQQVDTGVPMKVLQSVGEKMTALPEGFTPQRQVGNVMEARQKMISGEQPLDWGCAENLAYATLLQSGKSVRFTGEDVRRGTFAHRHAVLHDVNTGAEYCSLKHLSDTQGKLSIYDSILSEAGVLGFEYGFSSTAPGSLVLWEAQFGDFANGAQVLIDQFITSAWQKWNRLSGLVMLLPHGQEAMGPEHSSARLERYMQLAAQDNIQVCVPSTPAQIFHLLRRQVLRQYRRPLIVMSPKSLLRHKLATSSLDELANGRFQLVIPEVDDLKAKKVRRVIFCAGKVYYDLLAKRRELGIEDIAILRIEQLYPFPYDVMRELLKQYAHVKDFVWCQEEPKNQGAWFIGRHRIEKCLNEGQSLRYVGRGPMAAPAPGYPKLHNQQQEALVNEALS